MGYSYNRFRSFNGYRKGTGWDEVPLDGPRRQYVKQVRVDAAGRCEWQPDRAIDLASRGFSVSTILRTLQEQNPDVVYVLRDIPETVWS